MTGRTIRTLIIVLASLVLLALVGLCIYALIRTAEIDAILNYSSCIVRTAVFFIFLLFYYNSLFSGSGIDTAFLPLFLLFSMVLEFRILPEFAALTLIMPVNPVMLNRVLSFALLMTGFSIFGFGFFYQNREPTAVSYFLILSLAFSLLIAIIVPATQKVDVLSMNFAFSLFVSAVYSCAAILFLRQIILDPPGTYLIRHFSALLFLVGNILNLYFDERVFTIAGTAYTVLCYITVMLVSRATDVKY